MVDNSRISAEISPSESVAGSQLREIFRDQELFSELSDSAVEALARSAERIFVAAGAEILSEGDQADAAFVVEHGRLRCDWGLDRPLLGDNGRGDVVGLVSVIGQVPMSGSVVALRDARLIRIPAAEVLRAVAEHPDLLSAYSRWHHDVLLRSHQLGTARKLPNAFAVLPIGEDPAIARAQEMLCDAFGRVAGGAVVVDDDRVRQILGAGPASDVDFDLAPAALLDWCEKQEARGNSLFFACDETDTAWTRWCLRQTDKIVVIACPDAEVALPEVTRRLAGRRGANDPVQVSLVLVQDEDTDVPQGTRRWLDSPGLRAHHHVRVGQTRDFDRAARRLGESAVGVALGGGGARGFAHVGVLQALEEAGIVVDHVGGTSMGSIIAASYARGWKPKRILEIIAEVFTESRAIIDPDIPLVALLSGRKLDRLLQSMFGEIDVGDLWLPFYAISSSLSKSGMFVHDRGALWEALRASASLPGVFPPVSSEGHLLVDGGIVNNVPMDVMRARCGEGPVIAVDVGAGGAVEVGSVPSGWQLLGSRLNPVGERLRAPNIGQVMVGSTMMSSKQYLDRLLAEHSADLYLRLPVEGFNLLGFDEYQRLYEIGYETTREALARGDLESAIRRGDAVRTS